MKHNLCSKIFLPRTLSTPPNNMWQVFQNFPENNKDGLRMRFYLVLKFFVSTITWETWKNLKHFTVNQRFLWFYDFSVDLALWGYEKIKSSKEKKLVRLIFSFSVKYFIRKLDPISYLLIKYPAQYVNYVLIKFWPKQAYYPNNLSNTSSKYSSIFIFDDLIFPIHDTEKVKS